MLGDILLARNDAWLHAGPRALIAFTADNADIKFPLRLPIQEETHEVLPLDVKRHAFCGALEPCEQARDMQEVIAAIAGYFGGYSSKMQSIGERERERERERLDNFERQRRERSKWKQKWRCTGLPKVRQTSRQRFRNERDYSDSSGRR